MSWALIHGLCVACKATISYHPHHVPSLTVNGQREPLCRTCHARWNVLHRTSKGLDPIPCHPDAYEPVHESEL